MKIFVNKIFNDYGQNQKKTKVQIVNVFGFLIQLSQFLNLLKIMPTYSHVGSFT